MCSSASVILACIFTILVKFWSNFGTLKRLHMVGPLLILKLNSKVDICRNPLQKCYYKTYKDCENTCEYYNCRWKNLKYWLNTCKYYHNTYRYCHIACKYWAGESEYNQGGRGLVF